MVVVIKISGDQPARSMAQRIVFEIHGSQIFTFYRHKAGVRTKIFKKGRPENSIAQKIMIYEKAITTGCHSAGRNYSR